MKFQFARLGIRFAFCLLSIALLLAGSANGQSTPKQADGNLGSVLQTSAQKVLSSCQSWPPELAPSEKEQTRKQGDKALSNQTSTLISQLGTVLDLDPNHTPFEYDGAVLRLLDSIGTYDPNVPNHELLGLAQNADITQLYLWGTNLSTVKYDCLSLLQLAGQGGTNYVIPLFSLNASLKASQNVSTDLTSTFIYGSLQSPFDVLYYSGDPTKTVFSAFHALDWRLAHPLPNSDKYIATSSVLAVTKGYAGSESSSILGNMKGGVSIPAANVSGSLSGQLTRDFQANSSSYETFFWNPNIVSLPAIDALTSSISSNLPLFNLSGSELTASTSVQATSSIVGWATDLCSAGKWTIASANNVFTTGALQMNIQPSSQSMPVCAIIIPFQITPGTPAASLTASAVSSPKLMLTLNTNAAVKVPVQLNASLHLAGKSSASIGNTRAQWAVLNDAAGNKANLSWQITGHVDTADSRVISQISFSPGDFSCKQLDGTSLQITGVQIDGKPGTTVISGNSPDFAIDVLLFLQGIPSYDTDYGQTNKALCSVQGSLSVTSTDAGGVQQVEKLPFTTGQIAYPNQLPTAPPPAPAAPTLLTAPSQVALSWHSSASATSYNVYRATSSGSETQLKSGVADSQYTDTSIANGTTYFYQVTAVNAAGESSRSSEVSTPH